MAVTTTLFALLFKFLPDVVLAWRDVITGALVTAVLFAIGKEVIGLYLGRSTTASSYGAAGSVVVLLLWVYYTSQIVLLGAEFTRLHADRESGRRAHRDVCRTRRCPARLGGGPRARRVIRAGRPAAQSPEPSPAPSPGRDIVGGMTRTALAATAMLGLTCFSAPGSCRPTRPHLLHRRARPGHRRDGRGRAVALVLGRVHRGVGRGRCRRCRHPVVCRSWIRPTWAGLDARRRQRAGRAGPAGEGRRATGWPAGRDDRLTGPGVSVHRARRRLPRPASTSARATRCRPT